MSNILDGFVLPQNVAEAGAREDVAKMSFQNIGDGVSVMSGFDKGISYRFLNIPVLNEAKSQEAGMDIFDEEESIEFFVDSKTKPVYAIKFLSPDRLRFNRRDEIVGGSFKDAYDKWKLGLDTPGLALEKWDVINYPMVKTFNSEGIFSVEQLGAMPRDAIVGRFQAPFVEAYEKAIQYVSNHDMAARSKEQVNKLLEVLDQQNSKIEALQAQISQNKPVRKVAAKKRKPVNKLKKPTAEVSATA